MRSDSRQWTAAKVRGDGGELSALKAWESAGFDGYLKPGWNAHDLLVVARVECKADRKAVASGCVAVEVAFRGQPSGIANSEADLWQFDVGVESIIVPTARLRALVNAGPFRHVLGGDGKASDLILVPLLELRRSALLVLPGEGNS